MKWTYNKYRATLVRHGKTFALVTPNGKDALSPAQAQEMLSDLNGLEPVYKVPKLVKHRPLRPGQYILLPYAGKKIDLMYRLKDHGGILGWRMRRVKDDDEKYAHVTGHDRITPTRARRILADYKISLSKKS